MKKVLCVEDDPQWGALLERYLAGAAMVRRVISAGQALEMIDIWRPDVVVLDMLLAGETGMALLNELRSHEDTARLPVVVYSSVSVTMEQLTPFGVVAVLDKASMTPDEVRGVLREVLA